MSAGKDCWEKVASDREAIKNAVRLLAECSIAKRWPEWNIAAAALLGLLERIETYEATYKTGLLEAAK